MHESHVVQSVHLIWEFAYVGGPELLPAFHYLHLCSHFWLCKDLLEVSSECLPWPVYTPLNWPVEASTGHFKGVCVDCMHHFESLRHSVAHYLKNCYRAAVFNYCAAAHCSPAGIWEGNLLVGLLADMRPPLAALWAVPCQKVDGVPCLF